MANSQLSRRQFFRLGGDEVVDELRPAGAPKLLRPPGAVQDNSEFLERCTSCGDCEAACPHGAIMPAGAGAGTAEGTPVMAPFERACRWCRDFPCIAACSTGALARDGEQMPQPIVRFAFDLDRCLTRQGILCDDCSVACPSTAQAITMLHGRMPVFAPDRCVGCGLCARTCMVEPSPFSRAPIGTEGKPV